MHLMHLLWLFGKFIGLFHGPAVLVTCIMLVVGIILIGVFYQIFKNDLFDDSGDDN